MNTRLIKRALVAGTAAAAVGVPALPASAAPVVTGGLVNVTIIDAVDVNNNEILNDVNVAAAIAIAANVCDVNVNVIARQVGLGDTTCTNPDTGDRVIIND